MVELSGSILSVAATTSSVVVHNNPNTVISPGQESQHSAHPVKTLQDSLEEQQQQQDQECELPQQPLTFHSNTGKNVVLKDGGLRAVRGESYNQGLVMSNRPLARDERFKVTVGRINKNWSSSLLIGT